MTYTYQPKGVCSRQMTFDIEDGVIRSVDIVGGCSGNLQGISRLVEGMKVEETLIGQYLHNEKIVREFAAYYDLFNKYKKEYETEEILEGTSSGQTAERARIAAFDERLSLLGMLIDKVSGEMRENQETSGYLTELFQRLKAIRTASEKAVKKIVSDTPDAKVEDVIRLALKML